MNYFEEREKIEIDKIKNQEKIQKEIDEFNKNYKLEIFLPNQYRCYSQVEIHEITSISLHVNNCIYIKSLITGCEVKIFNIVFYDVNKEDSMEIEIDKQELAAKCGFFNDKIEEKIKWLKIYLASIELLSTREEIERDLL